MQMTVRGTYCRPRHLSLAHLVFSMLRAIYQIEQLCPGLGLHINLTNRELFSGKGSTSFPPEVKSSMLPNIVMLHGVTYWRLLPRSKFIAKCSDSRKLLCGLVDVAHEGAYAQ